MAAQINERLEGGRRADSAEGVVHGEERLLAERPARPVEGGEQTVGRALLDPLDQEGFDRTALGAGRLGQLRQRGVELRLEGLERGVALDAREQPHHVCEPSAATRRPQAAQGAPPHLQ